MKQPAGVSDVAWHPAVVPPPQVLACTPRAAKRTKDCRCARTQDTRGACAWHSATLFARAQRVARCCCHALPRGALCPAERALPRWRCRRSMRVCHASITRHGATRRDVRPRCYRMGGKHRSKRRGSTSDVPGLQSWPAAALEHALQWRRWAPGALCALLRSRRHVCQHRGRCRCCYSCRCSCRCQRILCCPRVSTSHLLMLAPLLPSRPRRIAAPLTLCTCREALG
jgi:hypothetical protein